MIVDNSKEHATKMKQYLGTQEIYATIHSFEKASAGFHSLSQEAQKKAMIEAEKKRKYIFSGPHVKKIPLKYRRVFKPARITLLVVSPDLEQNLELIQTIRKYADNTAIAAVFIDSVSTESMCIADCRQIIEQCDYFLHLKEGLSKLRDMIEKIMSERYGLDLHYYASENLALFSNMPPKQRVLFYKDRYMHISEAQYAILRFLLYNHPTRYDASEILRYCLPMREKQKNYVVSTLISSLSIHFKNELSDDGKTMLISSKYGVGYGIDVL